MVIPEKEEVKIQKVSQPIGQKPSSSRFNIGNALKEKEVVKEEETTIEPGKELPNNHFTQLDLEKYWSLYLQNLRDQDMVVYSAVSGFTMHKIDQNTIEVRYPSDSAKSKFEKIQAEFFNKFKHKVNHFNLEIIFSLDVALKKEIVTKKTIFEKYLEINPLLKDLDDLVKFDFS